MKLERRALADNYAEALFKHYGDIPEKFKAFADSIKEQQALLLDPHIPINEKTRPFKEFQSFLRVVLERKDLDLLGEIERSFERLSEKRRGVKRFYLESAGGDVKVVEDLIKSKYSGFKIYTTVNRSLIGGFVLRCEDSIFDFSIKGKLEKIGELY